MASIAIKRPDDMHVHFRDGDKLKEVAPWTARTFARALIMPNVPAITTVDEMLRYRQDIILATKEYDFTPLMTLKMHRGLTPADLKAAKAAGCVAVKIYPHGVTTGSEDGLSIWEIRELGDVFNAMCEHGLVLCWHAQMPGKDTYCLDREIEMMSDIDRVVMEFPGLRQVVEHVSTAEMMSFVLSTPDRVGATVTAHHLVLTLDDVLGGGLIGTDGKLYPHHYCAPIPQSPRDRSALVRAVTSGNKKVFLGTDSAPHLRSDKESACGCAGIFSAPTALSVVIEVFQDAGALDKLEAFTSVNGASFYGLPTNTGVIRFSEVPQVVRTSYCDGRYVPFMAGRILRWSVGRY